MTRRGWSLPAVLAAGQPLRAGRVPEARRDAVLPPSTTRSAPGTWKSWSHSIERPPASPRSPAMACGRRGSPRGPAIRQERRHTDTHSPRTRPSWERFLAPARATIATSRLGGRTGGRHSPLTQQEVVTLLRSPGWAARLARLTPEPGAIVLAARRAGELAGGREADRTGVDCLTHQPPLSSISAEVASVRPPPRPGAWGRSRTSTRSPPASPPGPRAYVCGSWHVNSASARALPGRRVGLRGFGYLCRIRVVVSVSREVRPGESSHGSPQVPGRGRAVAGGGAAGAVAVSAVGPGIAAEAPTARTATPSGPGAYAATVMLRTAPSARLVALTIDDGPTPEWTPQMLTPAARGEGDVLQGGRAGAGSS